MTFFFYHEPTLSHEKNDLKISNCDKTQKLRIVTELKNNQNCGKNQEQFDTLTTDKMYSGSLL